MDTAAAIQKDMEVYAADGEKLGTIKQVWPQVDGTPSVVTTAGYFSVHERGLLGIGGKDLYIPFRAVDDCVPDECVTITGTKEEVERLYTEKPSFLVAP